MLRLEQLSCGYGQFRAVDGLSFDVERGGVFALVGANGAGKSSTIMAIAGHVEIQEVVVNQDPVNRHGLRICNQYCSDE